MTELLSQFQQLTREVVEGWISSQRQEDLRLEFKTLSGGSDLNRDDRKNFAVALSGFTNSDGGLIVWGVDARRDEDGVDAASGLVPIPSVAAALSRLQSLTSDATSPVVSGVEHREIELVDGNGLIVTLVPRSDAGPHMALLGEQRYYKRSGDSFRRMEHFDVADMFGRRPQPGLSLSTRLAARGLTGGPQGRSARVSVVIGLVNDGRGTARFPLLRLTVSGPLSVDRFGLDGNGRHGLPPLPQTGGRSSAGFGGGADSVVHPGDVLEVTQLKTQVRESAGSLDDSRVDYEMAAEGVPLTEGSIIVTGEDIIECARAALNVS